MPPCSRLTRTGAYSSRTTSNRRCCRTVSRREACRRSRVIPRQRRSRRTSSSPRSRRPQRSLRTGGSSAAKHVCDRAIVRPHPLWPHTPRRRVQQDVIEKAVVARELLAALLDRPRNRDLLEHLIAHGVRQGLHVELPPCGADRFLLRLPTVQVEDCVVGQRRRVEANLPPCLPPHLLAVVPDRGDDIPRQVEGSRSIIPASRCQSALNRRPHHLRDIPP